MEDAFDLNDELDNEGHDTHESTPLTINVRQETSSRSESSALPGAYDFEREYDFPPPGSPPPPSARALPNDYGNSNGLLPTAPVAIPKPRRSIFRRIIGAVLPTQYQPVATEERSSRPTGGGTENDGVFANVTAKPQPARVIQTEDGNVHIMPEDNQKESPPTYLEAQADAVPPYWETTIHAPAGLDPNADLVIDDLPTGSFLIFCLNIFISFFFQFVGFLLTYLLHTSHAAKFGSRAGLGLTLIQYGFYSRTMNFDESPSDGSSGQSTEGSWLPPPTASAAPDPSASDSSTAQSTADMISSTSKDWLSFLFMTLGWFLLLSSVIGFWKVKRWEQSIRPSQPSAPLTADDLERDRAVRRNLEEVFGLPMGVGYSMVHSSGAPTAHALEEARLARDLRAAGLI